MRIRPSETSAFFIFSLLKGGHPATSFEEYDRTEAIFDKLMNKGQESLSPEESRLFALLANLLADYEKSVLYAIEGVPAGGDA